MRNGMQAGIVIALLFVTAGCAAPRSPSDGATRTEQSPTTPKRIVAAVASEPPSMNSNIARALGSAAGAEAIGFMASSALAAFDHRGILRPQLVEAAPTAENGQWKLFPDGRMEITWKIRANAEWHDGTPVTAEDVVFTHKLTLDREVEVFRDPRPGYNLIDSIEAVDPHTVVTRWRQPHIWGDFAFSYAGDGTVLPQPRHILERAYTEDKAGFLDLPYWTTQFVGSGPYKLKEWVSGSHVILRANDRYVLGRPRIDEVEVRFIADSNTLVANILAGAVDVTLGRALSLDQAGTLTETVSGIGITLAPIGAQAAYPQFLNPNPPILSNVHFRRALLHATDRQQLVDTLMGGRTTIAHTFINPLEADYGPIASQVVEYGYDPQRAVQLMEELGYRKGSDGQFADGSGQKPTVEVRISGAGGQRLLLAVAALWQQIGVPVDPQIIPPQRTSDVEYRSNFPAFEIVRRGNFRFDLTGTLGSAGAPLPENRYIGNNRGRYQNADLDALFFDYHRTIAARERSALLGQIVRHVSDQVVLLGLYNDIEPTVYSTRLRNVQGKFERSTQVWNVHEWDLS